MAKSVWISIGIWYGAFQLVFAQADSLESKLADTIQLEAINVFVLPFEAQYREATGGVFVVSQEQIKQNSGIEVANLYNTIPGIQMSSGALNTYRLVIRGVGSRTPYNTNRIRAYLDDIPLTLGDGISTIEDQDPSALGSIEVLKGPASALYGSGLGGVVRLNSPYPTYTGYQLSAFGEGASFDTQRHGATGAYKSGNLAFSGGLTRSTTQGWRENSNYNRTNAFLHGVYFHKHHTLKLTISFVDLYAEIPSSINEADFKQNPEKAGGSWGTINGYEESVRLLAGLNLTSRLSENWDNHLNLFSTYADPYERRPFNVLDDETFNLGLREYITYHFDELKMTAGLEYFHEKYDWKTFETLTKGQGDLLSNQGEKRKYLNGFWLGQWKPGERLVIDAGLNLNILTYNLNTRFNTDGTDQSGRYQYQPILSPRLGLNYAHNSKHHTYASVGHGFSAPSLEETLMPEGNINTTLKPETGWNLELGNRGALFQQHLKYDFTLYAIFLKNLLVTERLEEDVFTGKNAGKALNTGLESWLHWSLFTQGHSNAINVDLTISYTLSRNIFRDFVDDDIDYSGNHLPGIPRQQFVSQLGLHWKKLEARIRNQYTGSQFITDANDMSYKGYFLTDLNLSWEPELKYAPFSINLYGGVRNISDTRYASMLLINAPSFGGSPRYYYPGTPRQFYIGLRMHFTKHAE